MQLGIVDVRDAVIDEPPIPALVFTNKERIAVAIILDDVAAEVTLRTAKFTLAHSGTSTHSGWKVIGYGSEQSYRTDKLSGYKTSSEDMMSYPLVREDG